MQLGHSQIYLRLFLFTAKKPPSAPEKVMAKSFVKVKYVNLSLEIINASKVMIINNKKPAKAP